MRIFPQELANFESLRKFAKICENLRKFAINLFIILQCFSGFGSVTVTVAWQIFEYYEEWLGQTMDTLINFFPMHIFQTNFKVGENFLKESDFEVKFFISAFNLKKKSIRFVGKIKYFPKMSLLIKLYFFQFSSSLLFRKPHFLKIFDFSQIES